MAFSGSSPASIVAALKSSPRGQLVYHRQASPITKCSTQRFPQEEIKSPLAGSFADVSSVLEDVSNELGDIQMQRVASVIKKLELNKSKNDETLKDESDDDELDGMNAINLSFSSPKVSTPIQMKTDIMVSKMSPTLDELTMVVGQELLKLENERKIKVQSRIKERKQRLMNKIETQRIQRDKDAEKVQKIIDYNLAQIEAKEKEAEAKCISKSSELAIQEELIARKAREAQIEADLLKAKQIEAAKVAKRKNLLEQINIQIQNINVLKEPLFATVDVQTIDSVLKPIGLNSKNLHSYLETVPNNRDHLESSLTVLNSLNNAFGILIKEAIEIKAKKEEDEKEAAAKAVILKQEAEAAKAAKKLEKVPSPAIVEPKTPVPVQPQSVPNIFISPLNESILQAVTAFRDNYISELKQMNVNKDFKFTCQKAVTTPLNAISDVTAEHLKDKLSKLIALTNGQPVQATESTRFQASSLPELYYAKNLLAEKLISHGEEVVAAKSKNAFAAASLIVTIWSKNPDFGNVFLAYLFEACPFLAPKYPQRPPNVSDAEYFKMLGYTIGEGVIEDKTMYLKRMSGLSRMYAAITISRLPGNDATSQNHPHGLGNIWRVLSSTMNLEPLNDITATILYDILSVTGAFMLERYGQMFKKLLQFLADQYFPKITRVTEEGCGGPLARLELFLRKAITNGAIDRPEGLLRADFL